MKRLMWVGVFAVVAVVGLGVLVGGPAVIQRPAPAQPTSALPTLATLSQVATSAPAEISTATPTAIPPVVLQPTQVFVTYTVKDGDVFSTIAYAYGLSVDSLQAVNQQLADISLLNAGMVLTIPVPTPSPTLPPDAHIVQSGETLASIAATGWEIAYTVEDVMLANRDLIRSLNQIQAGWALRQPDRSTVNDPACSPEPPRTQVVTYEVKSGQNLNCLAQKFGLEMSTLLWANADLIQDPDLIYPGQTLTILPVDGMLHTVAAGDTLDNIARRYLVTVDTIVAWQSNGLDPSRPLSPNQQIVIPNAEPPRIVIPQARLAQAQPSPTPNAVTQAPAAGTALPPPASTAAPSVPAQPGALEARHDPWSALSSYDTGFCPGAGGGSGWSGQLAWPTDSHDLEPDRTFSDLHQAIDILAKTGSPVYAADTGVVIWAGFNVRGYGNLVILNHGAGWLTLYGHLDSVAVQCGQSVGRGAVIGAVGQTGASSFEHLHFELRRGDYNYDPLTRLPH